MFIQPRQSVHERSHQESQSDIGHEIFEPTVLPRSRVIATPDATLGKGSQRLAVVPVNPDDGLRFFNTHLPVFHKKSVFRDGARLANHPQPEAATGLERRHMFHLYGAHL